MDLPPRFPREEHARQAVLRTDHRKLAAVRALADLVGPDELSPDYIIPAAFDRRVCPAVAKAVAEAARRTGAARA